MITIIEFLAGDDKCLDQCFEIFRTIQIESRKNCKQAEAVENSKSVSFYFLSILISKY